MSKLERLPPAKLVLAGAPAWLAPLGTVAKPQTLEVGVIYLWIKLGVPKKWTTTSQGDGYENEGKIDWA